MTSDAEKMTLLLPTTSKIASNVYISFRCQLCWPHYRLDINCGPPRANSPDTQPLVSATDPEYGLFLVATSF